MVKRVAIHFARFGPYHLARISAAVDTLKSAGFETIGLETAGLDDVYAWNAELRTLPWQRRTVFPGEEIGRAHV